MTAASSAASPSMPATNRGFDLKPMPGVVASSDAGAEIFAKLLLQPSMQLTNLPEAADLVAPVADQVSRTEAEDEPSESAEADAEPSAMAAPILAAFLNPMQQAPQSAAAVTSATPPLATAAPDVVWATKMPPASAPVQRQPTTPAAPSVNAGIPELSLAPHAATAEMASRSGVGRVPIQASIPLAIDTPESLRERGSAPVAPAPAWSMPALNAGDAALPSVRLTGASSQWQQPLRQALGEQLQVQVERGSEQAVIRLSPPMLGRIEISIRHEAGALQVHMNASNNEILRQLQGIGDSLRQDLSQRHQYSDVAVVVSAQPRHGEGDGNGRQRHEPDPRVQKPGLALADADQGGAFALLTDGE